jgi:hypothetical protein
MKLWFELSVFWQTEELKQILMKVESKGREMLTHICIHTVLQHQIKNQHKIIELVNELP